MTSGVTHVLVQEFISHFSWQLYSTLVRGVTTEYLFSACILSPLTNAQRANATLFSFRCKIVSGIN